MTEESKSLFRHARLSFGNVPVVSLIAFRWMVLCGSVVHDLALTRRAAVRRMPDGKAKVTRV